MKQSKLCSALLLAILILSLSSIVLNQPRQVECASSESLPEVSFTVYPDGWVSIDGFLNQTMYPYYSQPTGYAAVEFGWDGSLEASLKSEYNLPSETVEEFPLNSTSLLFYSKKVGDVLSSQLDATVVFPPVIEEWGPLSSSDLVLVSEFQDGEVVGNVTVLVAGFPMSVIDFFGNLTHVRFVGDAVIPFISFQGIEINRSVVVEGFNYLVENFTGQDSGSLYEMTGGVLECPSDLFENVTIFYDDYASVAFEMEILGNFTGLACELLFDYVYGGYYPPEFEEAMKMTLYESFSSAFERVQRDVLRVTYTYSDRKLVVKDSSTVVVADWEEGLGDIWAAMFNMSVMPSGMDVLVEGLLAETFVSVESAELSATYSLVGETVKEGSVEVALDVVFSGDLNEEVNHLLPIMVEFYVASMPSGYPVPWQFELINSTLVDVGRLRFSYNVSESSMLMGWEGLRVLPPRTVLNSTHFRLEQLFNLTSPSYGEEARMSVSVVAGDNVTHGVSIVRPNGVPDPDSAVDGELMVWENVSLSDLQPLVFEVESLIEGVYSVGVIDDPGEVSEESPFIVDATSEANVTVTVTNVSGPVTFVVRNFSEAAFGEAGPGAFKLLGRYVEIICDEGVVVNATIRINYSAEKLAEVGLDVDSLRIHYWDSSAGEWVEVETHVNAEEHYAWAVVDHLSVWGLFGQVIVPFWMQWGFYAIIAVVVVAVGAVVYLAVRRRGVAGQAISEPAVGDA